MSGGNKRSYTYKYTELLLPPGIKGQRKTSCERWKVFWKIGVLGILKHTTFQNTVQLSQPPEASTERCSLKIVVIKF